MKLAGTIQIGNTLGESILWDDETQSVWWTDIEERRLYRCAWSSRALDAFVTPERLCSFGFVAGSRRLIAAFESGFALYDPFTSAVSWLARPPELGAGIRLNDGRVDGQGRFWVGSMAEDKAKSGQARLYCVDANGQLRHRESGVCTSNAICWSPDSTTFYFADSPARTIWRYAFDAADGGISDRRIFAQTAGEAEPDGATVDREGYVWNAEWRGHRVVRYAPDGRIDRVLALPVSRPTCVAFGGPDLDLLFVTSARQGLSQAALASESGAGNVFVYNVDIAGLPEHRFRFVGEPPADGPSGGYR